MPDSRTLWTAVVIICIAVSVFFSVKKRTTFKRLQQLMAAKQWDEFDRLLDGKLTSMLYPRYNRDYLRLNSYLLREDHKRADEMFDLLLGLNLPKMQRVDLVIKAFNYYVGQEDRKKAKELLHEIKGFEGGQAEAVAHECQLMYDTMILKRHNDIPELERMARGCRRRPGQALPTGVPAGPAVSKQGRRGKVPRVPGEVGPTLDGRQRVTDGLC